MEKAKAIILIYFDKVVAAIAVILFAFALFNIFNNLNGEVESKTIKEISPVVDRNIKLSTPPEPDNFSYAKKLEMRLFDSPVPQLITQNHNFKLLEERDIPVRDHKPKRRKRQNLKAFEPGDTEIMYKGGTLEKAIILVKKKEQDSLIEQTYVFLPGDNMDDVIPINSKTKHNFMTGCTLLEIIPNAKKPLNLRKMLVNLDSNGKFLNTEVRSNSLSITTMKIVYKNERLGGDIKELFVGSIANIGTITAYLESQNHSEGKKEVAFWEPVQDAVRKIID